jgi:hypothetical protein
MSPAWAFETARVIASSTEETNIAGFPVAAILLARVSAVTPGMGGSLAA